MPPGGPPPFDPNVPDLARMHEYWLGGHDNYQADRTLADTIQDLYPPVRQMVINSRLFAGRAVTWAASQHGIIQFIDLGSGLPFGESIHRMARAVRPRATVAYVDNDPEVTLRKHR